MKQLLTKNQAIQAAMEALTMNCFEIIHQSKKSRARVGRIITAHGVIETPNFVPVATNATIKAVDSSIIEELGVQLLFCNTYHLLLHPGPEIIKDAGGLHTFMNRSMPIITDSGGFQVFSLAYGGVADELKSRGTKKTDSSVLKISEEGVTFRSYRDGKLITLTPETSVAAQKDLGADIIIPLDELHPYHIEKHNLKKSFDRTHRWELRSLNEHVRNKKDQAMYAVIHGGMDRELRKKSIDFATKHAFDGYAMGGSLGKTHEEMYSLLRDIMPHASPDRPVHLLGIGDTPSIEACIPLGIDTFDSSYPTKCARHGILLSPKGPINITRTCWKTVHSPISTAPICKNYSAAYLHHLFKAHEATAHTLASIHNIHFMIELMRSYREKILRDEL